VERVFELDSSEAVFGCFGFKRNKQILIVGRSAKRAIDVFSILAPYGGGGHAMSASVTLKKRLGNEITDELISLFREKLAPDLTAADIMDKSLPYINEEWDLYRTSRFLEDVKQSGLPVVNEQGKMVGNISLRNISLARKNEDMKAPVKGYMEADVPICYPFTSVHEVENIFFSQAIGRLPVLDMQGRILGVITRERYLEFLAQTQHKIKA
jgi:tRNA nucleotidyltransferase (CCA-adding enzyme)